MRDEKWVDTMSDNYYTAYSDTGILKWSDRSRVLHQNTQI